MSKILLTKDCVQVTCDSRDTATQQLMMSILPIHSNRSNTVYKTSVRNLPEILRDLRGITHDTCYKLPEPMYNAYRAEMQRRAHIEDLRTQKPNGNPVVTPTLTLDEHQQRGREIAQLCNKYAFFYDTRTGKTPMSLAIINDDVEQNPTHKWLVVCPLILIENAWLPDAARFMPHLSIVNCHASTKAKRLKAMKCSANIYVTNTESFITYKEYFDEMGFTGCIVDESSDMKSAKSKVSKALVEFAQTLNRFYLLSGTPAPNGEYEYYMQMKAVDYYCMPSSYAKFKEYYFVNLSYNPQFEKLSLRPDKREEFNALIKEYAIYVDKEDVLETPGRDFYEVPFDMPDELRKQYRKLKNGMSLELNGTTQITAASAAANINKLNQVSSGFIIDTAAVKHNAFYEDSNEKEWYLLSDYRFNKLLEILEQYEDVVGEQVLIWANYRIEFALIEKMLTDKGYSCRCIHGGVSISQKNEAIKLFKEGTIQYLIANPASADKGLTLTNAHIAIYFSLSWSYELYKQSTDRIYGAVRSQPKRCIYYVLLASHSIDEVLYRDVLLNKQEVSYAVLNYLKGGVE